MVSDEPTEELGPHPGRSAVAPAAARIGPGTRLNDDRYVLEHELGRGGMATVWLARDERLERPVAVKVLAEARAGEPGYLARFEREVRVAAGLTHPNLVKIYDSGSVDDRPFLVMEYLAGGDLAGLLAVDRAPDPDRLARELLAALRHIHGEGVVHRDVKVQNVLIGSEGGARLTDFGIAQPRGAASLTEAGTVLGTARYIAPEVLSGAPPSERSDLYSLGVVLGDLLAARPGSRELGRLVGELRAADPEARPASAEAALARLEDGAVAVPLAAEPVARSQAPTSRRADGGRRPVLRRPPALAGAAAAAIAALGLGAAVLAAGGEGPAEGAGSQAPAEERPAGGEGESQREAGNERAGRGAGDRGRDAAVTAPPAASGSELNDRGYSLIQQGRPAEAIPVLQRAVAALEGTGEITHAYALFNLGHALRLSGRPEEAIPVLEQRLEIPNQRGVVERELETARADAS